MDSITTIFFLSSFFFRHHLRADSIDCCWCFLRVCACSVSQPAQQPAQLKQPKQPAGLFDQPDAAQGSRPGRLLFIRKQTKEQKRPSETSEPANHQNPQTIRTRKPSEPANHQNPQTIRTRKPSEPANHQRQRNPRELSNTQLPEAESPPPNRTRGGWLVCFSHTPSEAFKAYAGQKKDLILSSWSKPPGEAPRSPTPLAAIEKQ
jgi:hypothetical protein